MSDEALIEMQNEIMAKGVNLFGNHEHTWENTLGIIKEAKVEDHELKVGITMDNPLTNPKVDMLMNKIARGIKLGLSVGGAVTKERWTQEEGKRIKVIDGVRLYEISVVGIPSNTEAFLSMPQAISKCLNNNRIRKYCPCCYNKLNKNKCDLCLWQK
jgi:HK97 family phage prohead protease